MKQFEPTEDEKKNFTGTAMYMYPGDQAIRITLPNGTTPKILNTTSIPDEVGAHHTRLFFR